MKAGSFALEEHSHMYGPIYFDHNLKPEPPRFVPLWKSAPVCMRWPQAARRMLSRGRGEFFEIHMQKTLTAANKYYVVLPQ